MQNTTEKYLINEEKWLDDISLSLIPWDKIFFYGDLGAGKTTYIRKLIQRYLHDTSIVVRSPTYTYYSLYEKEGFFPIYHFDLYRLESVEVFFSIGGMEILEQKNAILLIEWPEILWNLIEPTKKITLTKWENQTDRILEISQS